MSNLFKEFLVKLKKKTVKILVVGDAMVDEIHHISVSRISPEFPIPVNKSDFDYPNYSLCGGSANVAAQFQNFNVDVRLASFIDDESKSILENNKINIDFCHNIYQKIPRKKRFYDKNFPLFRWDIEKDNYGLSHQELFKYQKIVYEKVINSLWKPDVTIFSDYNKGFFINNINNWMKIESIKIVDPKATPLEKWQGCDIFKPNINEAKLFTQETNPSVIISKLKKFNEIIITDGGNGFYYEKEIYKPEKQIIAKNVVGAGDCFVAFLAVAKGLNYSTLDAAILAYEIGAIYVQNQYNKPLSSLDLNKKFINIEDLVNRDFTLVMSNGVFDLLHINHIELLKFAKSQGNKLIVALNSDKSVKNLKGNNRPIYNLDDRMNIVSSLECVDYVISFDEDTPYNLIKKIKPDIIVKGGDYTKDSVVGNDLAEVVIFPYNNNNSTTKIISKIKNEKNN